MKKAMEKWLNKRQIAFDPDAASSICKALGLEGEKSDVCFALCYQLENGGIAEAEFTGGLCVLTGKEPEEVMGVLMDMKGTRLKMTLDELDKKAITLFIKRHGREAYESGEIGETLERIEQRAEEYDPVFLSKHPELKGKSITVYHDPLAGEDWAVVNNETGEVVEIFNEEVMEVLKGVGSSNIKDYIECRKCGACCEVISISSPIPGMPGGKPAGVRCIHLTKENLCNLFGKPERPKICSSFPAMMDICGATREEALQLINALEIATSIGEINDQKKD